MWSSAAWGEAESSCLNRGWDVRGGRGACSNHPRATARYVICQHIYLYKQGTNGCRGSGPSVTETFGTEATYYSIIQPPPSPLASSPPSRSTHSISHSVSFSCKLFQPAMKSQPTLLWTDSCSWLSEPAGLQNICHILQSHR